MGYIESKIKYVGLDYRNIGEMKLGMLGMSRLVREGLLRFRGDV